jgi:hypothetical protein
MAAARAKALLTWPCPAHLLAPLDALEIDVEPLGVGADTVTGMQAAIAGKTALLCHPWVPVTEAVMPRRSPA